MLYVTLDTNCLITMQQNRPGAEQLRQLPRLHKEGQISLRLAAITASEKQRDGSYSPTFATFEDWLKDLGLSDAGVVYPLAYSDITYWDVGYFVWDAAQILEVEIHSILFPKLEYQAHRHLLQFQDSDEETRRKQIAIWRNAKCDVQAFWSHCSPGGGIFITNDKNFLNKKAELLKLSGGDICTAQDCLNVIDRALSNGLPPAEVDMVAFLKNTGNLYGSMDVPKVFKQYWRNHQAEAAQSSTQPNAPAILG